MKKLHLVCLREPDPDAQRAIHGLFDDGNRLYEISDTQFVVVQPPNGGKSVYERIKAQAGKEFAALVVRFERYHGRHNTDLWEWLEAHGG